LSALAPHKEHQRDECLIHQAHEAAVTNRVGKLPHQMELDMQQIIGIEVAITRLMKVNDDFHDLTQRQACLAPMLAQVVGDQEPLPLRFKLSAEVIDKAKHFD
jgi:hypothetical protein